MESNSDLNCGRLQNIPIETQQDKIKFLLQLQQELHYTDWNVILDNVKQNPSQWITLMQNDISQVIFINIILYKIIFSKTVEIIGKDLLKVL